jgi:hypothetical protein
MQKNHIHKEVNKKVIKVKKQERKKECLFVLFYRRKPRKLPLTLKLRLPSVYCPLMAISLHNIHHTILCSTLVGVDSLKAKSVATGSPGSPLTTIQ